MTSIDEAREIIYERFRTQWGSRTIFTFENERFNEPENEAWVRVSVRNAQLPKKTLGGKGHRRFRRYGTINIQIFIPSGSGMADSGVLSQAALDIFEGENFSGVDCNDGTPTELPIDGKWQPTLVEISFDYEETK